MAMNGAWSLERERFLSFVQTMSAYDALREHENSALRDQVHDLTELLAAFDLCDLKDPHLIAVRDRAFQRDITPEVELLRVYFAERQMQQEDILNARDDELIDQDMANDHHGESNEIPECLETSSSVVLEIEGLQQRIELLEREVIILRLRQELAEETTTRSQWPAVNVEADQASQDHDVENDQEQGDHVVCKKHCEGTKRAIQAQQERIVELEEALAVKSIKNAALQQQSLRYRQVENILLEFSQCCSSAS